MHCVNRLPQLTNETHSQAFDADEKKDSGSAVHPGLKVAMSVAVPPRKDDGTEDLYGTHTRLLEYFRFWYAMASDIMGV
jgi:hypothetical protein